MNLLVNIDVPDLEAATRFYVDAFGFTVGRRMGPIFRELLGAGVPVYLLVKPQGTAPFAAAPTGRSFDRHWTPVHLDLAVDDLDAAVARALAAGARRESEITTHAWGRMCLLADPFGHGVCLLDLTPGYDALVEPGSRAVAG
jgi:catechol 2,3-dioxygenase-like lactoylglutathione lyase family enzyme